MLHIKNSFLVGKGTNRECYVHPDDPNKCLKVTVSNDHKESWRETRYYRLLQKREIDWQMLARFYGTVKTDMGDAMMCDLPRDYDGKISKTLYYYLSTAENTKLINNPLPLLYRLHDYIIAERVIVKDLNFRNMLYQKLSPTDANLIIIDGIGNHEFIPFSTYIDYFTLKKINKRWDVFEKSWRRKHKDNPIFIAMLNDSKQYTY